MNIKNLIKKKLYQLRDNITITHILIISLCLILNIFAIHTLNAPKPLNLTFFYFLGAVVLLIDLGLVIVYGILAVLNLLKIYGNITPFKK